ncbi:MAG: hypothetical protein EZS28_035852 [Streblomastix strix]|uniref:Uncharacterized protein n=1 Tax=Streblomastix strix TaxID=222440 RepID=A0A5J4UF29_9EUKA|nr:MAG: hypothetical protein EZS28_035852 [Streblomastix strix]
MDLCGSELMTEGYQQLKSRVKRWVIVQSRCMTYDNPPVILEQQAAWFDVICRIAPVVVDSIQCWRIFACESCFTNMASC